jgi:hypothetical protein
VLSIRPIRASAPVARPAAAAEKAIEKRGTSRITPKPIISTAPRLRHALLLVDPERIAEGRHGDPEHDEGQRHSRRKGERAVTARLQGRAQHDRQHRQDAGIDQRQQAREVGEDHFHAPWVSAEAPSVTRQAREQGRVAASRGAVAAPLAAGGVRGDAGEAGHALGWPMDTAAHVTLGGPVTSGRPSPR